MKVNTVLLWVTYMLLAVLLGLIILIVSGQIILKDDSWVSPIATLVGGLGGALAGTWLSGINSTKQWEKQKTNETNEKRYIFNRVVYESLSVIYMSKTSIHGLPLFALLASRIRVEGGAEIDSVFLDEMDEKSKTLRLYDYIEKDLKALYLELDLLYSNTEDMVKSGIVDWDTYTKLNFIKFSFGVTREIETVKNIATSSDLKDDELEKLITEVEDIEESERQYYRDVFNSRGSLIDLYNATIKNVERIEELVKDLGKVVKSS